MRASAREGLSTGRRFLSIVIPAGGGRGRRGQCRTTSQGSPSVPIGRWVVDCAQCRNDPFAELPIGIGMPLRDRETAERLRENHAGRAPRLAAS